MFIYICISVYCLYIVYKYLGMTPSGTYNCSIVIIFYFPCISLFYSFVCSSHLCILSYTGADPGFVVRGGRREYARGLGPLKVPSWSRVEP